MTMMYHLLALLLVQGVHGESCVTVLSDADFEHETQVPAGHEGESSCSSVHQCTAQRWHLPPDTHN